MDEINENSNYQIEYNQKNSNFDNIIDKYSKQVVILDNQEWKENNSEIGNFWIFSTEIKNDILDFCIKNIKWNPIELNNEYASETILTELKSSDTYCE